MESEREEEEERPRGARATDGLLSSRQRQVYALLLHAGVGARSPKMAELLRMDLAPEYVEGWVRRREKFLADGVEVPVGHLITKLTCLDPVPPDEDELRRQRREALMDAWGAVR